MTAGAGRLASPELVQHDLHREPVAAVRLDADWPAARKWTWSLVAIVVGALWGSALVVRLAPPFPYMTDFCQEWTSARNWFEGRPVYLSLRESIPLSREGWNHAGPLLYNAHPPASVLLSLPLGRLDYETALVTWNVVSLAILASCVWLLTDPRILGLGTWYVLPVSVMLLTSNSLAQDINHGQWNSALLLLLTMAWLAARTGRAGIGGLLIGLAAAIKLFPAFLALYFLVRRQGRGLAGIAVGFVSLNAITVAVLGWQCFPDYVTHVLPTLDQFRDWWVNASLAGFWCKLFDARSGYVIPVWQNPPLAKAGIFLSSALVCGLCGWKIFRAREHSQQDVAFGVCMLAMMLVSPITWDHYFLLLLLPMAIFWVHAGNSRKRWVLLAAVLLLATVNPHRIWDLAIELPGEVPLFADVTTVDAATSWQVLTVISCQFYALLALFLGALTVTPDQRPCRPSRGAFR